MFCAAVYLFHPKNVFAVVLPVIKFKLDLNSGITRRGGLLKRVETRDENYSVCLRNLTNVRTLRLCIERLFKFEPRMNINEQSLGLGEAVTADDSLSILPSLG